VVLIGLKMAYDPEAPELLIAPSGAGICVLIMFNFLWILFFAS